MITTPSENLEETKNTNYSFFFGIASLEEMIKPEIQKFKKHIEQKINRLNYLEKINLHSVPEMEAKRILRRTEDFREDLEFNIAIKNNFETLQKRYHLEALKFDKFYNDKILELEEKIKTLEFQIEFIKAFNRQKYGFKLPEKEPEKEPKPDHEKTDWQRYLEKFESKGGITI
jgi:hypothetical protein